MIWRLRLFLLHALRRLTYVLTRTTARLDPGRCEERESGGARCELVRRHRRGHYIRMSADEKPHPERYYT